MPAHVVSLHRYPVKGFPAEGVPRAVLEPGAGIPGDRVLAVSDGTAATVAGKWNRWSHFFALKKRPDLAAWTVETTVDGAIALTPPEAAVPFDADTLRADSQVTDPNNANAVSSINAISSTNAISIDPADANSRSAAAPRIAHHLPGADPNAVEVVTAYSPSTTQGMFDSEHGHVSLISLATVRALSLRANTEVDPLRFRGNLLIDGIEPFAEFDLIGAVIRIGEARLLIRQTIERCTATTVSPQTAISDLSVPRMLAEEFGHIHCGVYGEILTPGEVQPGDPIVVETYRSDHPLPAGTGPRSMVVIDSAPLEDGRHLLRLRDPYRWFPAHWEPGQHVRVHLPVDGQYMWRTYTAVLTDDAEFSLVIGIRGTVSTELAQLAPGDRLTVSGPFGALTASRVTAYLDTATADRSLALVTSGVGLTTALALLPGLPDDLPVQILHIDHGADLGSRATVDALRRITDSPGRSLTVWDTSEQGRPTEADLTAAVTGASAAVVCGGAEFVTVATAACVAAGILSAHVHREAFTSPVDDLSDRLKDFAPAIIERPDGTRLMWTRDDGTLLDALEADGARIPFTCRSGSCGTCTIAVNDPSFTVQVLDATAEAGSGHVLACSTVPVGTVRVLDEG